MMWCTRKVGVVDWKAALDDVARALFSSVGNGNASLGNSETAWETRQSIRILLNWLNLLIRMYI
jgi:hypothetical protein